MTNGLQTYPALIGNTLVWLIEGGLLGEKKYFEDAAAQCDPNPPPFIKLPLLSPRAWQDRRSLLPVSAQHLPYLPWHSPIQPLLFANPAIEYSSQSQFDEDSLDRRHFWNMLVTAIPQSSYRSTHERPVRILDVGCGGALDAMPLHAYFEKSPSGKPGNNVTYLGVDISTASIERAKARNPVRSDLNFLVADAADFNNTPELRGQFDVIVIRHHAVGSDIALWSEIFKSSLGHLEKGGVMLITSYTCVEHQIALARLKEMGAHVHLSGQNPFARKFVDVEYAGIQFQDQYVAVVSR